VQIINKIVKFYLVKLQEIYIKYWIFHQLK